MKREKLIDESVKQFNSCFKPAAIERAEIEKTILRKLQNKRYLCDKGTIRILRA